MEVILMLPLLAFSFYYFYCKVICTIQMDIEKDTANKIESILKFDEKSNVLNLYGFHPDARKVVKMKRYEMLHTAYQPETITFTSATVGNVTTGGVSKNDAYTYISGTSKTDKYELLYMGKAIKTIRLCNNDVKNRAKQLGMEKYMNNNGDIVVIKAMPISKVAAQAALAGYYSQIQKETLPGYPDEAKCREILNFVCNSI